MDPLSIIAIITGLSGLSVAICTHLKRSECCAGFCSLTTRTPPPSVGAHESTVVTPACSPIQSRKEISV